MHFLKILHNDCDKDGLLRMKANWQRSQLDTVKMEKVPSLQRIEHSYYIQMCGRVHILASKTPLIPEGYSNFVDRRQSEKEEARADWCN